MKAKRIKHVIKKVYEMPNPIFCYPFLYFQHKDFLCEVAAAKNYLYETNLGKKHFHYIEPLDIFDLLFTADGYWVTILERTGRNEYKKRHDLNCHINSLKELNSLINRLN